MISANQKYKQSGTSKSFKEWLKDEQKKGELDIHEKTLSVEGTKTFKLSKIQSNTLLVLGFSMIGYGLYKISK